ncbi:MAG TPA: hypothetical protein PLJ35_04455 [Anaerolineae bacterium]|nr:hypothetical protein [Anaerolineae bacterium]HOQ98053.1 hypothetical protein [Anaerolineae bacterium]HPL29278.1 hypothetical protein [Anaerolineae bacterium]
MGIPTTLVLRKGFRFVVQNGISGMGLPREVPTVYEFPVQMFLPNSDLTPIRENIDKIVYALTQWQPAATSKGTSSAKVTIQGEDYAQALSTMNFLFLRNQWSDGQPVLPATEERVQWILTGTDLAPDTAIGKIMPRGGIATVTQVAVALAMVGGRPEYLPVLIAGVQAMVQPKFLLRQVNASTCPMVPALVVNGPIAKQIRLSSGYGCMGSDPNRPAAAAIGRAQRLLQQNLGGAIPGIGTMANYGPQRAINAVLAEDEEGIPEGWGPPLNVERGFSLGSNVVTAVQVSGWTNVALSGGDADVPAERMKEYLCRVASFMGTPSLNNWGYTSNTGTGVGVTRDIFRPFRYRSDDPDYTAGLVLIPRGWAADLQAAGYSKETVKAFLWEASKIPWPVMRQVGLTKRALVEEYPAGQPVPITRSPKGIMIVVGGGEQSGHAFWMQPGNAYLATSQEISLPRNWHALLQAAEEDLGPLPAIK